MAELTEPRIKIYREVCELVRQECGSGPRPGYTLANEVSAEISRLFIFGDLGEPWLWGLK